MRTCSDAWICGPDVYIRASMHVCVCVCVCVWMHRIIRAQTDPSSISASSMMRNEKSSVVMPSRCTASATNLTIQTSR